MQIYVGDIIINLDVGRSHEREFINENDPLMLNIVDGDADSHGVIEEDVDALPKGDLDIAESQVYVQRLFRPKLIFKKW